MYDDTLFSQFETTLAEAPAQALAELSTGDKIATVEDRRAEWLKQRWGKFTASEFHKLMGYEDKDGLPNGAQNHARKKAVELLTECEPDTYVSPAMQWGLDHEHEALDAFVAATGIEVSDGKHDQIFIALGDSVGGTPDGLIPALNAGIEIKCPNSETHLGYLETVTDALGLKAAAPEYYWQIQGLMLITGCEQWYFVSYDPRYLDEALRLHIATIERQEDDIVKLRRRLDAAIECRDAILSRRLGQDKAAMVRRSIARHALENQSLQARLAELVARVANLEVALSNAIEKTETRPTEAANIPERVQEHVMDDDGMDIDDAEGISGSVDVPDKSAGSILPSQACFDWRDKIRAIDNLSDIGRAAHAIKGDKALAVGERDELLRELTMRQQAIKKDRR